jgi:hypothetical protein
VVQVSPIRRRAEPPQIMPAPFSELRPGADSGR